MVFLGPTTSRIHGNWHPSVLEQLVRVRSQGAQAVRDYVNTIEIKLHEFRRNFPEFSAWFDEDHMKALTDWIDAWTKQEDKGFGGYPDRATRLALQAFGLGKLFEVVLQGKVSEVISHELDKPPFNETPKEVWERVGNFFADIGKDIYRAGRETVEQYCICNGDTLQIQPDVIQNGIQAFGFWQAVVTKKNTPTTPSFELIHANGESFKPPYDSESVQFYALEHLSARSTLKPVQVKYDRSQNKLRVVENN